MSERVLKRPGTSEKMKGKQNRLGHLLSEEAKAKRKEKMGDRVNSKRRISIVDIETGIVYASIMEAAKELNINLSTLNKAVHTGQPLKSGKTFQLLAVKE